MVTLELSTDQVIQLVKQLPEDGRSAVLHALREDREAWWQRTAASGEADMRRLARDRGLDWEKMSEAEREVFVDDVLHEAA